MDQLSTLLSSLGPWGILAAWGIKEGVMLLRARMSPTVPTPAPVPGPNQPAPVPAPAPAAPSGTPILDLLMSLIRARLMAKIVPPAVPVQALPWAVDIDDATVDKLLSAVK